MTESGNHRASDRPGYVPLAGATELTYRDLGFKCGLEIHQQLATRRKLFCRCPAGIYQDSDDFDAQLVRHMRPTLSELGEYDGTALMEFKTKKNIVYRIKGETACTYDIDDTPPFPLNREALAIAMQIALLLETSIVGELHITRKQYLDGSIPTGFQRTAIVGIDGSIPTAGKRVGIRQLSIEEDSCREVSDRGHERVYTTDRLGMPLVETVTEPELLTPSEAAEAADYLRYLARSTGLVNTGIGAARQDVNVSIEGGTRVEIKGVQHIRWIPELTHNEAFRQNALLSIRDDLLERVSSPEQWSPRSIDVERGMLLALRTALELSADDRAVVMRLPQFGGILARFSSPGRCFADELSDRVKVVACLDKPNMLSSETDGPRLSQANWERLRKAIDAKPQDGLVLIWGAIDDLPTAVETIEERCQWAFDGVPNETRKAMPDGTTIFERVLPGPDRMYPDTDSAPIPIDEAMIAAARAALPTMTIAEQLSRLRKWGIPEDTHRFILRNNLFGALQSLVENSSLKARFAGTLIGHVLRSACRGRPVDGERLMSLVRETEKRNLAPDILKILVPLAVADAEASLDILLERAGYEAHTEAEIAKEIDSLCSTFGDQASSPSAHRDSVMGRLRPLALGNVRLCELAAEISARLEEALQ